MPVFPILMPASWPRASTQVVRPIIGGLQLPHIPVVAPVSFIGDPDLGTFQRIYFRQEYLEANGWSEDAYFAEAFANLRRRPAVWERDDDIPGLSACGPFLSSEKLLDRAFMQEASRALGAPGAQLVVTIPARGYLFATTYDACRRAPEHYAAFVGAAGALFEQSGDRGITPWPFLVVDSRILAILETTAVRPR